MAQGPNDPQGPFLFQEDGKTYASLTEYPAEPPFRENGKRLQGGGYRNTTNSYGQGPGGSHGDPTGVRTES